MPAIRSDSEAAETVGYLRFLTLLFAHLPHELEYTADSGKWSEALFALREHHGDEHPELFDELEFLELPNTPPYTSQVRELLSLLQFGNIVEVANPNFRRLRIRDEEQTKLRDAQSSKVSDATLLVIRDLAAGLLEADRERLVLEAQPT